eukprot:EG_transcript_1248
MAREAARHVDGAFDSLALDSTPSQEAGLPRRPRRWLRCRCSISIVLLMLTPTVAAMVAVALIAWFMIYNTASGAVDAVGHQGQQCFVKAVRDSILDFTTTVQRVHSVEQPRWQNTTCDGTTTNPNVSAFDTCDDVRLSLFSEVYDLVGGANTYSVAFPYGSLLSYQRTNEGYRWIIVDDSTGFWMRRVWSAVWQQGWAVGNATSFKPADLVASGQPLNMSRRVWYTDAVRNSQQSWSGIYFSIQGRLALPAVLPVYHPDGRLKLVAEAEVSLEQLDTFFTHMKLTDNTFAFVAELDGNLVASIPQGLSTSEQNLQSATGAAESRVTILHAGDERIVAAGTWLLAEYGSLSAVPLNDSSVVVPLLGESHYLFTGHIQDAYNLHWVIVIGLPRSDMLQGLDDATVRAILIIVAALLASMVIIGLVTFTIRCNLQLFAQRIKLMGTMDLEGAKQLDGVIFLSEARLILVHLQETIDNLQQFRTFLPPTMLDKVRHAEDPAELSPDSPNPLTGRPLSPPSLIQSPRSLRSPKSRLPELGRPSLPSRLISASQQDNFMILDPPASSSLHRLHAPASLIHTVLERRMEHLPVTLLCLELPHLHSAQWNAWAPADFMLWYETCLGTALGILQKQQGDFYRLMGDQLLFSWGAVRRAVAQCSRACYAALGLAAALADLDAEAPPGAVPYAPRLSVATGSALCGVMGTATTRDMYLVGPLVKQCMRLAGLNAGYGTHILVDVGVAKQCETTFRTEVCGLVYSGAEVEPRPVQPVYELLGPLGEEGAGPLSQINEEWMYRLSPPEEGRPSYPAAMDALRRGLVQQGQQGLEAFLAAVPEAQHARRMLDRLGARPPDAPGLEGLVD